MANEMIRKGNSYIETPSVSLTNPDNSPFELSGSTVTLTATDTSGDIVLTHSMVVDVFGHVTSSHGLSLAGTSSQGVVNNTLTAAETSAMDGWVRWSMTVRDVSGNTTDVEEGAWDVRVKRDYMVPNGISKRDLRRRILHMLGDLTIVVATDNGSDVTLIDRRRLIGEAGAYRGMQCMIVTPGLNYTAERYVTGSSRDNRSISFDHPLPIATVVGDEAELINFRGMGYHFDMVNRSIEYAVEAAADAAVEAVMLTNLDTYERYGTIAIPDDWISIGAVQWRDADDQPWQNLTYSSRALGSGWSIDRSNRTIVIGGERSHRINDRSTQIHGFRRPEIPVNDDDLVGINADWLTAQCVAELSMAAYRRNPTQERQQVMAMDYQHAGILRSRVIRRTGPNVIRI